MKVKIIVFILVLGLSGYYTVAQQNTQGLVASINQALAGSLQEITFTYTLDDEKLTSGGEIRFEYPVAYAETEFLFWSRPQFQEPDLLGYVSGESSTGAGVDVVTYGIAGGIFQCTLKEGELTKGDRLLVHYKGLVQSMARDFTVRAQVRSGHDAEWQHVSQPPKINILPQEGQTLILTSLADLKIDLAVVVLDKFGNLATSYNGTVIFQSTDTKATLPEPYTFTEKDNGKHIFKNVKYRSSGFQKITIETSNAMESRRTYATTGTRIYIDFTVNGYPMGSEIKSTNATEIAGKVAGTNKLETVEVTKYENGEYRTIYSSSPGSGIAEFQFEDKNFDSDCMYYLRVSQVNEVPDRLWAFPTNEMAWSSPIWVEFKK
ncbi:hypothetical protein ACFLU5_14465 [Bacteroidota bacterium]